MRARLMREHGTRGQPGPLARAGGAARRPGLRRTSRSWRWTAGSPRSSATSATSRSRARSSRTSPPTSRDRCTDGAGGELPGLGLRRDGAELLERRASRPGMNQADDTIKCELKPLRRADYGQVALTDAQWARAPRAFPQGVCDYTKRGVDRTPTVPWLSYADGPGGKPLGDPALRAVRLPVAALADRQANVGRVRVGLTRRRLARRVPGAGAQTTPLVALVREAQPRHGEGRVHRTRAGGAGGHDGAPPRQPASAARQPHGEPPQGLSASQGARPRAVQGEPPQPPGDRRAAREGALHRRHVAARDRPAAPSCGATCAWPGFAEAVPRRRGRLPRPSARRRRGGARCAG